MNEPTAIEAHWVRGDMFGLDIPADIAALTAGAEAFLTAAFHASGALPYSNRVTRIAQCEECFGGGTGRKALLAVEYAIASPNLPNKLFVKFSRNFGDPMRDRSKHMMVSEVKFAALSRTPNFPINVPQCLFADVNTQTGTGLMITDRIAFGTNGIEPQLLKCMDHMAPSPLERYRTIIKSLAQLSATHKAGRLGTAFDKEFPFDKTSVLNADPLRYTDEKLARRIQRIVEFIARHPQLFPRNLVAPEFHAQFLRDAPRVIAKEAAIKQFLYRNSDFVALCHWNANIDNAWFWRDARGELQCGLMDWGRVGQMTVAQTIYGAFSGAEKWMWDAHLDDIVKLFADEYARHGGPQLNIDELKTHTLLVTATMGLAYLMDAPAIIERQIADLDSIANAQDEIFKSNEDARVQLHMLTMFLNQWQTWNIGALVEHIIPPFS
jgi:hypothetical protein